MTGVYEVTSPACPGLPDGVICTYVAYPGVVPQVTLQNQDGEDNYPALANGSSIKALRLYYYKTANTTVAQEISNPVDFANITPAGGYAELPVDSSGNIIGNGRITGLENNGVYVFKMAHVDQAGNVGLFVANDAGATSDLMCATSDQTCHIAEPGAVEGILAKDLNCFIATAAYGSPFASKVQTFRAFRNKFLLHSYLGKKFIHFYYFEFGPNAADFIRHSDALRAMSRTALYPLWLFAKLSLELGFFGALCVKLRNLRVVDRYGASVFAASKDGRLRQTNLIFTAALLAALGLPFAHAFAATGPSDEAPPPAEAPYPNAPEEGFVQKPAPRIPDPTDGAVTDALIGDPVAEDVSNEPLAPPDKTKALSSADTSTMSMTSAPAPDAPVPV